jgi:hypothetical protein
MSIPNPFDPYRLQGCYGIPADVPPGLPWWSALREDGEAVGWRRIDGPGADCDFIEGAMLHGNPPGADELEDDAERARIIAEALAEYDTAVPLRRPTVLPGQVWAVANRRHPDAGWAYRLVSNVVGDLFTFSGGERHRERTGSTLLQSDIAGMVLVYGPGAPWAPPEWAPGKVWDGQRWVEPGEAPDGPA